MMGFNTTVLILNDCLSDIERNPEAFVQQLVRSCASGTGTNDEYGEYVVGQTTVMRPHHASESRLYATGGNTIVELSAYNQRTLALAARSPEFVTGHIHAARAALDALETEIARIVAMVPITPEGDATDG